MPQPTRSPHKLVSGKCVHYGESNDCTLFIDLDELFAFDSVPSCLYLGLTHHCLQWEQPVSCFQHFAYSGCLLFAKYFHADFYISVAVGRVCFDNFLDVHAGKFVLLFTKLLCNFRFSWSWLLQGEKCSLEMWPINLNWNSLKEEKSE